MMNNCSGPDCWSTLFSQSIITNSTRYSETLGGIVFIVVYPCSLVDVSFVRDRTLILNWFLPSANAHATLPVVITIMFKLDQSANMYIATAEECVQLATQALRNLENQLDSTARRETNACPAYGMFPGRSIHEPLIDAVSYATWLNCVTLLWQIVMRSEHKSPSWDELTCKLLATRCLTEARESDWIHKHAVSLLCTHVDK